MKSISQLLKAFFSFKQCLWYQHTILFACLTIARFGPAWAKNSACYYCQVLDTKETCIHQLPHTYTGAQNFPDLQICICTVQKCKCKSWCQMLSAKWKKNSCNFSYTRFFFSYSRAHFSNNVMCWCRYLFQWELSRY